MFGIIVLLSLLVACKLFRPCVFLVYDMTYMWEVNCPPVRALRILLRSAVTDVLYVRRGVCVYVCERLYVLHVCGKRK